MYLIVVSFFRFCKWVNVVIFKAVLDMSLRSKKKKEIDDWTFLINVEISNLFLYF